MNFFKGVKQKLSNVSDDISKSFSIRTPRKPDVVKQIKIDDCSFLGGAQLLEKYQNDWSSVHQGNEGIARSAMRIDQTIGVLHQFVALRHAQYTKVADLMGKDLPRLESDLDQICSALSTVHEAIERTELALARLEDQIEWCDLRRNEAIATDAWVNARRRSAGQMDAARVNRAREHAHRVAQSEQLMQSNQQERAATFEEEFHKDVQHFMEHGRIERTVSHASTTEEDLATIELSNEQDAAALDDFLNEPIVIQDESKMDANALDALAEETPEEAEEVEVPETNINDDEDNPSKVAEMEVSVSKVEE